MRDILARESDDLAELFLGVSSNTSKKSSKLNTSQKPVDLVESMLGVSVNKSIKNTKSKKNISFKLTQTQKTWIKTAVGKCEMVFGKEPCGKPAERLHHIIFSKREDGPDTYGNLIVLCGSCHAMAHGTSPGGVIPKKVFFELIKQRDDDTENKIKRYLREIKRKSNVQKKNKE